MKKETLKSRVLAEADYNRLNQISREIDEHLFRVRLLRQEQQKLLSRVQPLGGDSQS